ncbi:GDSL-type esterase/lipase family protein [Ideonella margarita]|uniref:GDSL-type esterase/lipase family protein n=1 Tax=Ideonella margarita TaxID=2984191 RepID=A0ABU9C0G4_9BURK
MVTGLLVGVGLAVGLVPEAAAGQAATASVLPAAGGLQRTAPVVDQRLNATLQALAAGRPINVVAIGGSITTGYAANPPRERGWAAQVGAWLKTRGQVRFINAGLSGTDSAVAVQRVQAQVLAESPDLVLVEFGVNDEWLDAHVRGSSYEGLLRQLLAAPGRPAVLPVMLTRQHNQGRDAGDVQRTLAARYGLSSIDVGGAVTQLASMGGADWQQLYDEPVHPNQRGHDLIARLVIEHLQAASARVVEAKDKADDKANDRAVPLPEPLHSLAHQHVRLWQGEALRPWRQQGFERGGPVHPEWPAQTPGWQTTAEGASASFLVWGTEVAVFHAESEHFRNLEAWVDDRPVALLRGHVPERKGYFGWHYSVVAQGLPPGAHLLHVRMRADEWQGSGRPASLLAVMGAGVYPPEVRAQLPEDLVALPARLDTTADTTPGAARWRWWPASDARLQWTGRVEAAPAGDASARGLAWSGSELRARFTGSTLALRLTPRHGGTSHYTLEVDGERLSFSVGGAGRGNEARQWQWPRPLGPGSHELRLVKRTEGAMSESIFNGLWLDAAGTLLPAPPQRPLRLVFYGDSITAGACNGDIGDDQYDDLSTHDGTRAYGALTAAALGADYQGHAVSGIGITRTWGELLMPQVWSRVAPRLDAPVAPADVPKPEVVLVNLGQNDHGLPASLGQPFASDFGVRYLSFVRSLRQRHPQAKLVLMIGGMSAWKEQPALLKTLADTASTLRAEGDTQVWTYRFEAFAWAHPRIDVHAQMADELLNFLRTEVLR